MDTGAETFLSKGKLLSRHHHFVMSAPPSPPHLENNLNVKVQKMPCSSISIIIPIILIIIIVILNMIIVIVINIVIIIKTNLSIKVPIVLVGNKLDLRNNPETLEALAK